MRPVNNLVPILPCRQFLAKSLLSRIGFATCGKKSFSTRPQYYQLVLGETQTEDQGSYNDQRLWCDAQPRRIIINCSTGCPLMSRDIA